MLIDGVMDRVEFWMTYEIKDSLLDVEEWQNCLKLLAFRQYNQSHSSYEQPKVNTFSATTKT